MPQAKRELFKWDSGKSSGGGDASETTYTPAVVSDWDSDTDPGNVDDALDQLAERVDDNELALLNDVVHDTGDETVGGTKTFSTIPVLPSSDPTTDNQAVRKAYVDGRTNTKTVQVVVFGLATAVETGDNKGMLPITDVIDGWNLTKVEATCFVAPSGGPVTVQLSRFSGTENDMLSTALSITAGNYYASTTSINTSYDDVEAGWAILFDVDAANDAEGLFVTLTFTEA